MKRVTSISILIAALVIAAGTPCAYAQQEISKKPEAGPAPKASFPSYHESTLPNGLKVLIISNKKQPLVNFRLMIKSGSEFEPRDKSGIAQFCSDLLTRGTKTRSSLAFAKEQDFLGISIGAGSGDDSMFLTGSGLKKYMTKILELMTDALFNPVFDQEEIEKLRKQYLSSLTTEKKNPDAISGRLTITVGFNDHPYSQFNTESSVTGITRDDIVAFHKASYIPNNASLAIVGDVTPDEVLPVIRKYFSDWKKGTVPTRDFPKPKSLKDRTVHLVDLGSSQTQTSLALITGGIPRKSPDYIPMTMLNSIVGGGFSGRLFQNLREKHGFTYGAYSSVDARKQYGLWNAEASVRREATDSAAFQILHEIRRIRDTAVTAEELDMHKQYISGTYLLSLESPSTTASRLQSIDLYGLPTDYYKNYIGNIMKLTPADIQSVSRKYLSPENIAITAVGDASVIKTGLEKFGPVQMYDTDMNPVEAPTELNVDINAETLLQKYIDAIGGKAVLDAIRDRTMEADISMSAGPQSIEGTRLTISKAPNKSYEKLTLLFEMGGASQTVEQEKWNDGATVVSMDPMRGSKKLEGDELAEDLEKDQFNELARWKELGYKPAVTSKKIVDGKQVYVLELKRKHSTSTLTFDAASFLLLKEESMQKTDRGSFPMAVIMDDYRKVDGLLLPHSIKLDAGMMTMNMKVTSYKHNTGVKDEVFKKK